MKSLNQCRKAVFECHREIEAQKRQINAIGNIAIKDHCPFKVGQMVTTPNRNWVIKKIEFDPWNEKPFGPWNITVRRYTKDWSRPVKSEYPSKLYRASAHFLNQTIEEHHASRNPNSSK